MITEKVMQHITNVVESYLMLGERVDGDNGLLRAADLSLESPAHA
jgi:hypothetical protein